MSIATRLWLALVLAISLVLSVAAFLRIREEETVLREAILRDRRFFGHTIRTVVASGEDGVAEANALMQDTEVQRGHIGVHVAVGGTAPSWLTSQPPQEPRAFANNEIVAVVDGRTIRTLIPVVTHNGTRIVIELDEPLDEQEHVKQLGVYSALVSSLALSGLAGLLAWFIVRVLVGLPLKTLANQARRIGAGDLDARVSESGNDEVSALAREMNAMATQLGSTRTALDEATADRVTLQEALRQGDRLRTVGQLAASLAHELGTPLNTIMGHARMVEKKAVDAAQGKSARMIYEQAERMAQLIRDLLEFGRQRKAERIEQDIGPLLEKTSQMLEPLAKRHNVRITHTAATNLVCWIDGSQMLQVLTNLVVNAVQALPQGGVVTLTADSVLIKPPADVGGDEGSYVHVVIEDNGVGISAQDLEHVFEPFFTRKGAGEGTGLGLPVVQGIVTAHEGWLAIESTVGEGTRVHLYFPRAGRQRTKTAG